MNWIKDKIDEGRSHASRTGILTILMAITGIVAHFFLKEYFPSLQFVGICTMLLSFGLGAFYVIDRFVFPNISFKEQIANNNVSVAITFAAIFAFIGVCELCAFAVFFTLR